MVSINIIVLCGGQGSRVKSLLGAMPKVLTPRNGRPHLAHLLSQINNSYSEAKVFLATGIGSELVEEYVSKQTFDVIISHESKPLGTGGAVLKCMYDNCLKNALVINGDTIYSELPSVDVVLSQKRNTVFLSHRENRDRFGAVEMGSDGDVRFLSKGLETPGLVNAGIYYVTNELLNKHKLDIFLSFENQIIDTDEFDFSILDLNFQDFGVPEDLTRFTDIAHD